MDGQRDALLKILASPQFSRADRRRRFLTYLAEETLAGCGSSLKETVIGMAVFDKAADYDPKVDSTVRAEAVKLRAKLREYYAESGTGDPVELTIPPGSYQVVFSSRTAAVTVAQPAAEPPAPPRGWIRWTLVLAGLAVAGLVAMNSGKRFDPFIPQRVTPITTYEGSELRPNFAPGGQVTFCWDGAAGGFKIYTLDPGAVTPRQITFGPAVDKYPVWSPSGQTLIFIRNPGASGSLNLIPAGGGPERKLADGEGYSAAWLPDGHAVLYSVRNSASYPYRVIAIDASTGERKEITAPPGDIAGDAYPAASPDGRWLAFVRIAHGPSTDLYVQSLAGGPAERLTNDAKDIYGVTWRPDGRSLVFSSDRMGERTLWELPVRVPALGGLPKPAGAPAPVPSVGNNALHPSFSKGKSGLRLAFQRTAWDTNLWQGDLSGSSPKALQPSSRLEFAPAISPEGMRVAFTSQRDGETRIWISNRDGDGLIRLGTPPGFDARSARWSPDGRGVIFEGREANAGANIYSADLATGRIRRITSGSSDDVRPTYSGDGRSIYFRSDRSGVGQVWKVPLAGGAAVMVTAGGATEARESPDGQALYVTRANGDLIRVLPGREEKLLSGLNPYQWDAAANGGIYFVRGNREICRFNPSTGETAVLKRLAKEVTTGSPSFAVSPDGTWAVWVQEDTRNSDAVLAEGR